MRKIIQKHSKKFSEGFQLVYEKRQSWNDLAERSTKLFETVITEAKDVKFFENLYIEDSRKGKSTEHMPKFIMFFCGRHPVGTSTLEDNSKLAVESGATLTFSQCVFGDVMCIMYPFKSDLHKRNENHFILSMPKDPTWYTEKRINNFIKYFFSYCQASSFAGNPDIIDKYRINKLITMNKIKNINLSNSISTLIKSIFNIIKTINTGS